MRSVHEGRDVDIWCAETGLRLRVAIGSVRRLAIYRNTAPLAFRCGLELTPHDTSSMIGARAWTRATIAEFGQLLRVRDDSDVLIEIRSRFSDGSNSVRLRIKRPERLERVNLRADGCGGHAVICHSYGQLDVTTSERFAEYPVTCDDTSYRGYVTCVLSPEDFYVNLNRHSEDFRYVQDLLAKLSLLIYNTATCYSL